MKTRLAARRFRVSFRVADAGEVTWLLRRGLGDARGGGGEGGGRGW